MSTTKKSGNMGERRAARYLFWHGYRILQRNYTFHKYEADIIAQHRKSGRIAFVEVKARSRTDFGRPCEAVNAQKRKNLYILADAYLKRNNLYSLPYGFDIVEVYLSSGKIVHIENAF